MTVQRTFRDLCQRHSRDRSHKVKDSSQDSSQDSQEQMGDKGTHQMVNSTTRIVVVINSKDEEVVAIVEEVAVKVKVKVNDNLVVRARMGGSKMDSLLQRMHESPSADSMLKCAYAWTPLCFTVYLLMFWFLLLDMFTNRHETARHPTGVIWFTICFEDMYNRFRTFYACHGFANAVAFGCKVLGISHSLWA